MPGAEVLGRPELAHLLADSVSRPALSFLLQTESLRLALHVVWVVATAPQDQHDTKRVLGPASRGGTPLRRVHGALGAVGSTDMRRSYRSDVERVRKPFCALEKPT